MNTNDTVSAVAERLDEQDPDELPEPASSALRRIQPYISDSAQSGNLAVVTGVVSLVRAIRTFRKGDRKRAMMRALGGLFWIGIAVSQRRRRSGGKSGGGAGSGGTGDVEQSDVADTDPDLDDLETPQEYGGEPATGEEVVDTTSADIDESDTAPELDSDVDAEAFDQSDVVGSDDIDEMEDGDEMGGGAEIESDEGTSEGDEASDTDLGADGVEAERDDSAMEFGDPEMEVEVGDVERESGEPNVEAGEMGTHVDEDEDEDESESTD